MGSLPRAFLSNQVVLHTRIHSLGKLCCELWDKNHTQHSAPVCPLSSSAQKPRGKYEQSVLPTQIRWFGSDKAFTGFFFLSWARKKLVLLFCVTSHMFYFCRKHLCGMKDVKLLQCWNPPKNVTSSMWIMRQPHLDIWLQGWTCYNTVQKWEIKPRQQEARPGGQGSDLQLLSAGGKWPNPPAPHS